VARDLSRETGLGIHERQQLERRLGLSLVAGLPKLEAGERATEQLRAEWAADWKRPGWPRPGSIESETPVPADVLDRLWRVAEHLGLTTHEATAEAQALGFRDALGA
jgi:hypothetical protein